MTAPIPRYRVTQAVTEMEEHDPRLAAHLDTVWPRVLDLGLPDSALFDRFADTAAAVLTHYGYVVTTAGRSPIDDMLTAAVRIARIPEPMGCRWCGCDRVGHGTRYVPDPGQHTWAEPTDDQRMLRIRALELELELEVTQ